MARKEGEKTIATSNAFLIFLQMVQQCSTTNNAATTTSVTATTRHLQQVQEKPQGNDNYHDKTRKTPIVDTTELITSNSFQLKRKISIGRGRKLQELYASKSHNTSFLERGTNNKVYVESYGTTGKLTNGSLMRHSSIRANSSDGDPFSRMRHFSGSRNPGCPSPSMRMMFRMMDLMLTMMIMIMHHSPRMMLYHPQKMRICIILNVVFPNDDMEVYYEHVLEQMHALWTIRRADLKEPGKSLRRALDHVPCGLDKYEWEWLAKEIYSKDPHKKASARNSVNRSCHKKDRLHRTGSKPHRLLKRFSSQNPKVRAELEVELNATRRKNEVLTDCLATVEAKNEKLQNSVESVETEMMKIKDLVLQQFNTRPPSIACDGHETRGSNLISIFILFFEN
ncbi:LOW QUALITY PROTEIN: hypothetical protein Cgig2_024588 [Carnegiea gigantea]|uniref:FHA domain-containing protein n=1 Tax=Carnegiea gigantea TaxID=171969 RepID=A0A9Q1KJ88_9CARY|nr:LOW QUALITY PROTEIN: hypothetical protein Cgig2_024588 [Carnegiea gigantea]